MTSITYFDNAATTFPKPEEVYNFMDTFYRECGVNVGRGQHKLATRASKLVDDTRKELLELNHCTNRKVVFTSSATEAINIVLRGVIQENISTVYISPFEHNAVTRVLAYLCKTMDLKIRTLACDKETLSYDIEQIKQQFLTENPQVVVISHASNVCGVVAPIEDICAISKKYGSTNIIDMCQTMGLLDTDLSDDAIDYAIFAGHKSLYGPFGVGGFICKSDAKAQPLLYGGTGFDSANPSLPGDIPGKFEVGSQNIMAIAGLNASLRWISNQSIQNINLKESENKSRLIELLSDFPNIKIVSSHKKEIGIGVISCVFDEFSSDNIGQVLSEKDIAVRAGLHCAPNAHRFLGTFPAGTVRFSLGYFNNDADFKHLHRALVYIYENS